MYNTADKLQVPLVYFPAYITELRDRIDVRGKEIDQIEAKKQDALKDCGITLELLQEYVANKPFLVQIQKSSTTDYQIWKKNYAIASNT